LHWLFLDLVISPLSQSDRLSLQYLRLWLIALVNNFNRCSLILYLFFLKRIPTSHGSVPAMSSSFCARSFLISSVLRTVDVTARTGNIYGFG
jgi:hypothetical protein